MKMRFFAVGLGIVVLSACASKPEPVEIIEPQKPQEVTPPVQITPAPAPVVEDRTPTVVPYTGPPAGTIEHFKYVSGEDRIYFGYDRYDLTPLARETLRKQAQWLNEYSSAIVVIGGNADERGTREYNLALGARRAEATKAFLVSQGVAPNRITTVSYGKERPIDPGSNEAAWARNRNAHSSVLVGGNS